MLTVGSLFSGAGLCDLGFSWAGYRHAFFCELDPFCRGVLARHWPHIPIHEDVRRLKGSELPPLDVLCGGFPCQDVSVGGKRAGIKEGTRSGLWKEFSRIIKEMRPRYVVIENVLGLLSHGVEIVLQDLAAIGYDAEWEVLPAAALGAPHHRERVFIVAYPYRDNTDTVSRVLSPLRGMLGESDKSFGLLAWAGIRIDRADRETIRAAYRGPCIHRVDDGAAEGLDKDGWPQSDCYGVGRVDLTRARSWIPRLKALGNGITPQQAYMIAVCILRRENLPVAPMP